jgi:predicted ester cyclase
VASTDVKRIIHRYVTAYESGDTSDLHEIVAADFIDRTFPAFSGGPAGVARAIRALHAGFSDLSCIVEQLVSNEDLAAFRFVIAGVHTGAFAGQAPTGRRVTWSGADFVRIRGGLIAELWSVQDSFALLEGIGAAVRTTR